MDEKKSQTVATTILLSECVLALVWMWGSKLAGAILVPWLWFFCCLFLFSVAVTVIFSSLPPEKDRRLFTSTHLAGNTMMFGVLMVMGHVALAMLVAASYIVRVGMAYYSRKENNHVDN